MPDDPFRALTGLYKLVEGVDKVIIERSKSLMLRVRLGLPVHEMRLISRPEYHCDEFFNHYVYS